MAGILCQGRLGGTEAAPKAPDGASQAAAGPHDSGRGRSLHGLRILKRCDGARGQCCRRMHCWIVDKQAQPKGSALGYGKRVMLVT